MVTSSKRAYATHRVTQVCYTQSLCPCGRPLLTRASAGNSQTLKGRSGSVSVGSLGLGAHKVLFEPFEYLWPGWSLILKAISPLLLSCWDFSFVLRHEVSPHSSAPAPTILLGLLFPWMWGKERQERLPQRSMQRNGGKQ